MRKALVNNFFALSIAAIICNIVQGILFADDLMENSNLFVMTVFGIVTIRLFKDACEIIDKRMKAVYIADIVMTVTAAFGLFASLYASYYNNNSLVIPGFIAIIVANVAIIFVFVFSALILRKFFVSKDQSQTAMGWMILAIASISLFIFKSIGQVLLYTSAAVDSYFLRKLERPLGLCGLVLFVALLTYTCVLLKKTAGIITDDPVADDSENDNSKYDIFKKDYSEKDNSVNDNSENNIPEYGYKSRAITAAVVVLLVFMIQTGFRFFLVYMAVDNMETLMSQSVTSEMEPGENYYYTTEKVCHLPADDWKTVTSLEEIKEYQKEGNRIPFVIEVDKANMEPISDSDFYGWMMTGLADAYNFLYGDSVLLGRRTWFIRDYKITFEDGSCVYATYCENMVNKLGDGVIKLPVSYVYNVEDYAGFFSDEIEYWHVLRTEEREPWMMETPVLGTNMDRWEFASICDKKGGQYYAALMILFIASLSVSARFLFRGIEHDRRG